MTDPTEFTDRAQGDALRRVAPPAHFDKEALQRRIERAIERDHRPRLRTVLQAGRGVLLWRVSLGAAAAMSLFVAGVWYGRMTPMSSPAAAVQQGERSRGVILDFSHSTPLGDDGTDEGLGMTMRCVGCRVVVTDAQPRWAVATYPVVDDVIRGGVADEAGLRAGDRILAVDGRDVRDTTGASPLNALPPLDFTVAYQRGDAAASTLINRRIVVETVTTEHRAVTRSVSQPGLLRRLWRAARAFFD